MAKYRDTDSAIVEAYDELEAGKTIRMWFESEAKFKSFRSMLYKYKSGLDEMLEFADPDRTKQSLSMVCDERGEGGCIYKLSMVQKLPRLTCKILVIEEPQSEAAE